MNKLGRPTLGLDAEYQIETAQNHIEANYWQQLAQMRVPTPSAHKVLRKAFPVLTRNPPTPKSPNGLRRILALYASSLFEIEAPFYPRDLQLEHWLRKLAERIVKRTLDTVSRLEEENPILSFDHHGLTQSQMREAAMAGLGEAIKTRVCSTSPEDANQSSSTPKEPKPTRLRATIECPRAARKMEAYIKKEGLGLTEFATKAGTTDRTLRNFRNTGRITRSRFADIARAMGTTKEALLKS